jgi:hypothetical protein
MTEPNNDYSYLDQPISGRDRAVSEPVYGRLASGDSVGYAKADVLNYPYQNETLPEAIERERDDSRQRLEQAREDLDAKIAAGTANHVDMAVRRWLEGREYKPSRLEESRDILLESQRMVGELYDSDPDRFNQMTVREWLRYTEQVHEAMWQLFKAREEQRIFHISLERIDELDGKLQTVPKEGEPAVTSKQLLDSITYFDQGVMAGALGNHLNHELQAVFLDDPNRTVVQIFQEARQYLHTVGETEAARRVQEAEHNYLSYYVPQSQENAA